MNSRTIITVSVFYKQTPPSRDRRGLLSTSNGYVDAVSLPGAGVSAGAGASAGASGVIPGVASGCAGAAVCGVAGEVPAGWSAIGCRMVSSIIVG